MVPIRIAAFALVAFVGVTVEGGTVLRRGKAAKAMIPGWSPVALPVLSKSLAALGRSCKCIFREECNCKASMEFMDCIADACVSGDCTCSEPLFQHACQDMSLTCPTSGIHCSHMEASCLHEEGMGDALTIEEILAELETMRERRCKLRTAVDAGWLNADNRLREIEEKIETRMKYLKHKGSEASPYMGCNARPDPPAVSAAVEDPKPVAKMVKAEKAPKPKPAPEPEKGADPYSQLIHGGVLMAIPIFIIAYVYSRHRMKASFPQVNPDKSYWNNVILPFGSKPMRDAHFRYPLFGCFEDMNLCCMAMSCFPVRWADTVSKFNLKLCGTPLGGTEKQPNTGFWIVFVVWMIIAIVNPYIWGLSTIVLIIMQVMFRQGMRQKLANGKSVPSTSIFQDCFVWMFCWPCAAVQEAREVEVWRKEQPQDY